jgi:hypothetical protein
MPGAIRSELRTIPEIDSLSCCEQAWLLKNSFSAQTASNPVIENVYPVRENRL